MKPSTAKIYSFSSGKGGVGKSTLVTNLGYLWSQHGKRTLLIDGDWHLGKLALSVGARPKITLEQCLFEGIPVEKAVVAVRPGLYLLPAPSGVVGFEEMEEEVRNRLFFLLESAFSGFDRVLLDLSSGIHPSVLLFAAACHKPVIVTTPEPPSYTDAYAIMKLLSHRFRLQKFDLIFTMAEESLENRGVAERFSQAVEKGLGVRVENLGLVPWEPKVLESIRNQQVFIERYPHHPLRFRLESLRQALEKSTDFNPGGIRFRTASDNVRASL